MFVTDLQVLASVWFSSPPPYSLQVSEEEEEREDTYCLDRYFMQFGIFGSCGAPLEGDQSGGGWGSGRSVRRSGEK